MTFYEVLNVDKSAAVDEIKSSYKEIAKIYHPDSNFFSEIIQQATDPEDDAVFKYITHAYSTLINESARNDYNKTLAPELPDWDSTPEDIEPIKPIKPDRPVASSVPPQNAAPSSPQVFQNQMDKLRNLKREQMGIHANPALKTKGQTQAAKPQTAQGAPTPTHIRPVVWYAVAGIVGFAFVVIVIGCLLR